MDLSRLVKTTAVYKEAKALAESKGKAKSFEPTRRYIGRRNNDFYKYLKDPSNLEAFCESLKDYKLSNYKGFALYKGTDKNGSLKYRPLLIPTHPDRLLFSIVNKILFPLFETHMKQFHCLGIGLTEDERKISTGPVIRELIKLNGEGYTHVLKTDFKRFFCTIPRGKLLHKIKPILYTHPQGEILRELMRCSLYNKISCDASFREKFTSWELEFRGVPQGLSYSSLLASFYGTILDRAIEGIDDVKYMRYLDDMVILGKTEDSINIAYAKLKEVSEVIGLDLYDIGPVSDGKTFMVKSTSEPYIFIGIEVCDGTARIPEKAIKRFKNVIEQEIINVDTISNFPPERIKEVFDSYTYGWKRAYISSVSPSHFKEVTSMLNDYLDTYMRKESRKGLSDYIFRL